MPSTSLKVKFSKQFRKSFVKLPSRVQDKAVNKMAVFERNPFDPQLKTHKLKGELKDYYSYLVDHMYRILFYFTGKNAVLYLDIGTYEVYR